MNQILIKNNTHRDTHAHAHTHTHTKGQLIHNMSDVCNHSLYTNSSK